MGAVEDKFLESDMFQKLRHRSHTMAKIVAHVERNWVNLNQIIETGTAYIPDCWSGHGQSTLVWDWLSEELGCDVLSIDINPDASAKTETKRVEYATGDSIKILSQLPERTVSRCGLLYLDSFDWQKETSFHSSFHHLSELATVWAQLPNGCMVAVDDRHSAFEGKHVLVAAFMEKMGIKPVFAEYQIAWIKPF